MQKTTSYRVRALGLLWDGSPTWGEHEITNGEVIEYDGLIPAINRDGGTFAVFPDFCTVSDFEIVKTETVTHGPAPIGNRYPPSALGRGDVTRTITDAREEAIRPWAEPESEQAFEDARWSQFEGVEG